MKILTLPLSDSYFITLFVGRASKYSISTDGTIIFDSKYVANEFTNERLVYKSHSMFGKITKMEEKHADKIMADAGYKPPYIDFSDRSSTFNSAKDSLWSFIVNNGWDMADIEKTWLIIPKPSKKLKGKPTLIEFEVGRDDFKHGSVKQDLEVFITPIERTSTKVTFSMYIPDFVYNKCMTDPDVNQRPLNNYIETNNLEDLHKIIHTYVSQARKIQSNEDDASKSQKVLLINFNSNELKTKDQLNFAYTGVEITTKFNFYIAYKYLNGLANSWAYYNFERLQSGMGSTEKGIKGLINTEAQGATYAIGRPTGIEIPWTQEREDFLYSLENQFRQLSINLNAFLKDINVEKLEQLMMNSKLLLLDASTNNSPNNKITE